MLSRVWSNVPIGTAVATGLLLTAVPATAQVQNETLTVQARIGELCTVTSASLDFGQAINLEVNTDATGAIEISCSTQTNLDVELDGGLLPGSGNRNMSDGQTPISYHLFKDSQRSVLWGAGDQVAATIDGTGSVPVYGRIPPQGNGHDPGLFTDEVTITLVF